MIKVLLCGEGPTDYGTPQISDKKWLEGAVQPIIRKIKSVYFENVRKDSLKDRKLQRSIKEAKVKGHGAKSFILSNIAKEKSINYIICYVDADREHSADKSESSAKKRFFYIYDQIKEGFNAFNAKNESTQVIGIPMIPIRMIESWLLSDEGAYEKCFGRKPLNPHLPKNPELIWGKENDSNSDFPKCYLNRVLKQYNEVSSREVFNDIANNIDIEILKDKCCISFAKFYEDFQSNVVESEI